MAKKLFGPLGIVCAVLLVLSGCGDADQEPASTSPSETGGTQAPVGGDDADADELEQFYTQDLEWVDCESQMHCTSVSVPLDYDDAGGEQIEIAVIASSVEDRPYLLINPGGPGQSGFSTVANNLQQTATDELIDQFNIVGFDPRGVYRSAPVTCMDDEEMDAYRQQVSDPDPEDNASFDDAVASATQIAQQCYESTGEVLGNVDTFSAARDMDIMRAALGQDRLDYAGFSYGTKLGLAYAELFPESVGRFVLDAMMDVSLDAEELNRTQVAGFEAALESFAAWCAGTECPVDGGEEDVIAAVQLLFADVQQNPRTAPEGRTINISTLVSGFITPMYHPQGWPVLREALDAALAEDDFQAFLFWADLQAGRSPDGSYQWINTWAFWAVMCLDYPTSTSQEAMDAEYEALVETAPTFGPYMGYDAILCSQWPFEPANEPWEPHLAEVGPILFIGSSGDPATPVQWAENMHRIAPESSLLVFDGEGHIAYRPGVSCVTDIVDEFLLSGELFEGRTEC